MELATGHATEEVKKATSQTGPENLHYPVPGHLARVGSYFCRVGMGSMQNRRGQQQQLRPDRHVLEPIRRGNSFRRVRWLTKRRLETALFTAPAGNSPLS